MTQPLRSALRLTVMAMACLLSLSRPVPAQKTQAKQHGPFVVALVDSSEFPYRNADAVIVRRQGSKEDAIVVKRELARPSILALGAVMLKNVRERHGELPERDVIFRIPQPTRTYGKYQEKAQGWMKDLARERPRSQRGYARARMITVSADSLP